MRWIKAIFWTLILVIVVTFVVQNLQSMNQTIYLNFDFYFLSFSTAIPLYMLTMGVFLLGVLFGVGYTFKAWLAKVAEVRKKSKEIKQLKKELDDLRNLPLTEGQKDLASSEQTSG